MRSKKAVVLYLLLSVIIWQLCASLTNILKNFSYGTINNEIFSLQAVKNNGAAFGFLNDNPYSLGFLGILVLVCIFTYAIKYLKAEDKSKILLISAFSAGILGNTIERLANGFVFDFIKISFFDFPVFNLYDILITGSVFFYIAFYIREEFKKRKKSWNLLYLRKM